MKNNSKNTEKPDWGKILQVAIAILTVIAGTFFESSAHAMETLRAAWGF